MVEEKENYWVIFSSFVLDVGDQRAMSHVMWNDMGYESNKVTSFRGTL